MKHCPLCGTELAEDAVACFHCGKSFVAETPVTEADSAPKAEEEAPAPVVADVEAESPVAPPSEQAEQPEVVADPVPQEPPVIVVPPKKLLLNTFQYMLLMLLFSIPVVGLIFLFIWGAGNPKNPSLKRFSAAVLLWRLILAVLLAGGILYLLVFHSATVQEFLLLITPYVYKLMGIALY